MLRARSSTESPQLVIGAKIIHLSLNLKQLIFSNTIGLRTRFMRFGFHMMLLHKRRYVLKQ